MELPSSLPKPLLSSARKEIYQIHNEHKNKLDKLQQINKQKEDWYFKTIK